MRQVGTASWGYAVSGESPKSKMQEPPLAAYETPNQSRSSESSSSSPPPSWTVSSINSSQNIIHFYLPFITLNSQLCWCAIKQKLIHYYHHILYYMPVPQAIAISCQQVLVIFLPFCIFSHWYSTWTTGQWFHIFD